MLVPQEVGSFQKPIARQDGLPARLRPEQRGIIADSPNKRLTRRSAHRDPGAFGNVFQDRVLV